VTKLVIQIPCYNEERSLPVTLSNLPRQLPGIEAVEWLVIDDGSVDRTVEVARSHGVDHLVSFPRHRGLARAFVAGLDACLKSGADIIVNTDADNQYCADDIPKLIAPILEGKAEFVIGARPIRGSRDFSLVKRLLQHLGSWVTRLISKTDVRDAPSGFRAMSREAAMKLHVFNEYTYTIETIIQAGQKGMAVVSVPIRTNEDLRPSRLVRSLVGYMHRQVLTMLRIFMTYKPFRFFAFPGVLLFGTGFLIGLRFVYFFVAALLMGTGFFLGVIGLMADLISVNRKLLEGLDWRMKELEDTLRSERSSP
jgi:glycosyltransferase involved in cell wall biosynthesis